MFTKKFKTDRERIAKQTSVREKTKVAELDVFDNMKKKSWGRRENLESVELPETYNFGGGLTVKLKFYIGYIRIMYCRPTYIRSR